MLEGIRAIVLSLAEIVFYGILCVLAYLKPDLVVVYFDTDRELLIEVVTAYSSVSAVLGTCLVLHMRLYSQQKKILDEHNEILAKTNRAKTEFLSNASHDMRTPLTVISVNVQTVMESLEEAGFEDQDVRELLQGSQNEVMHLARMVGGMLTLASMSESTEKEMVNLSLLFRSSAETLRLNLRKNENMLEVAIDDGLNTFGNADLLAQVAANILQNSNSHTKNGQITVRAVRDRNKIMVEFGDTGAGIEPNLLPHVFKRGISDSGTGLGLYLCKTVVESHGGLIWIESRPNVGTVVRFTLPFYEGRLGVV
jgi:signal transduction histidine kinase